jgi:superfamily I DNA/RNA helicase
MSAKPNLSEEQLAVINAVFKSVLLVIAYAGTGKSTTLKHFCKKHIGKTFLYFVFNKSMEEEAKESFKGIPGVTITTFHSFALRYFGEEIRSRLENDLKPFDLKVYLEDEIDEDNIYIYSKALFDLINEFATSDETMEEFVINMRAKKRTWSVSKGVPLLFLLKKLPDIWSDLVSNSTMPMGHDIYLKLFELSRPKLDYDYILVDEAQDISRLMKSLVLRQTEIEINGRKPKAIFVGDSFQSIYSWRGAVNSLEHIQEEMDPVVMYLSQSFRCPPHIGFMADAIIKKAGAEKTFKGVAPPLKELTKHKTYIARTNGGLFDFCMQNLDSKLYFVGGIKNYNFSDILDVKYLQIGRTEFISNPFIASFPSFKALVQYSNSVNDMSLKGLTGVIFKYGDMDLFKAISDIKDAAVENEKDAEKTITTCHKSKGLEWPRIELLDGFPLGNKKKMKKMTPAMIREEQNLLYVAITRSQQSVILPSDVQEYISA